MELSIILPIISIFIAIVTVAAALRANKCAQEQLALSTKEHLFDLRMDLWVEAQTYIRLYKLNRNEIERLAHQAQSKSQQIDTKALYNLAAHLIKTDTAEELNLLANKSIGNFSHAAFLKALENLDRTIIAIPLVFEGTEARELKNFVVLFRSLLVEMYRQYLENTENEKDQSQDSTPLIESSDDFIGNNQFDDIALNLKHAYEIILEQKVGEAIVNQIRLV